jgi:hypothetical protein
MADAYAQMFAYDIALSIELMTPVTVSKGVGSFMRYRFGYSRYVSRLNYHIIKNRSMNNQKIAKCCSYHQEATSLVPEVMLGSSKQH